MELVQSALNETWKHTRVLTLCAPVSCIPPRLQPWPWPPLWLARSSWNTTCIKKPFLTNGAGILRWEQPVWCRITVDSVRRRGRRSITKQAAGRWAWAGRQTQTRSQNWSIRSLENSWKAEEMFHNTRFGRVLFFLIHLRFQLSDQDEVGSGAGQRGGPADAGRIRNTDQESFPHFHLILRLWLDLFRCPRVRLNLICPFEKENERVEMSGSNSRDRGKLMLMLTDLVFMSWTDTSTIISCKFHQILFRLTITALRLDLAHFSTSLLTVFVFPRPPRAANTASQRIVLKQRGGES